MLSLVHCSSISGVLCSDIQAEALNILVANAALPFRFNHKSGISTYPAFSFDYYEQLLDIVYHLNLINDSGELQLSLCLGI